MAEWTPPKLGSPVWVDIATNDLPRAHKFYSAVFNWSFKTPAAKDNDPEGDIRLNRFEFNPDVNLQGALHRMPEETRILAPGRGGICLYWLVEDVQKVQEVIEQNEGKMLSGPVKEGSYGLYRYFEDPDGNLGAVYQVGQ